MSPFKTTKIRPYRWITFFKSARRERFCKLSFTLGKAKSPNIESSQQETNQDSMRHQVYILGQRKVLSPPNTRKYLRGNHFQPF